MASQVFSGSGSNFTYTNNTGQNVRVVINYCSVPDSDTVIDISFAGVRIRTNLDVFGRNLAFFFQGGGSTAAGTGGGSGTQINYTANNTGSIGSSAPTELMLAPGQVFTLTGVKPSFGTGGVVGAYNVVVIPEAG